MDFYPELCVLFYTRHWARDLEQKGPSLIKPSMWCVGSRPETKGTRTKNQLRIEVHFVVFTL